VMPAATWRKIHGLIEAVDKAGAEMMRLGVRVAVQRVGPCDVCGDKCRGYSICNEDERGQDGQRDPAPPHA
jgi:hypothetical protein